MTRERYEVLIDDVKAFMSNDRCRVRVVVDGKVLVTVTADTENDKLDVNVAKADGVKVTRNEA